MAKGRVKWFNNAKGYGFILPDNGGGDLFAHYTSIEMEGYKTLKAGQAVTFDIIDGNKGQHAIKIVPEMEDSSTVLEPLRDSNTVPDTIVTENIETA